MEVTSEDRGNPNAKCPATTQASSKIDDEIYLRDVSDFAARRRILFGINLPLLSPLDALESPSSDEVQPDKLHRRSTDARVSHIRPRHFVRRGGLSSTVQAASLSECVRPFRTTHVKATTIPFDKQRTRTNVLPLAFTRARARRGFHQSRGYPQRTVYKSECYHSPSRTRKIKGQTTEKSKVPANPFRTCFAGQSK